MSEVHNPLTETNSQAAKWFALKTAVEERAVATAINYFRSKGLEPILFKGAVAARNYPIGIPRSSTDIDLAFSSGDFEQAQLLAKNNEYQGLPLDIHREFKHLDTVEWDIIFSRSQLVSIGEVDVRVPAPEDHLRLLCVHWLVDGGWFRERLWDIYYAVDRRPATFDWSMCLDQVEPNRRRWIICAIGLAHRYLNLDVASLPFAEEARQLPNWLIRAVEREWASGLRLMPIQQFVGQPSMFLRQLAKRLPPNPITATTNVEGSFDSRIRFHYQIGSILKRIGPSFKMFRSYFSK